MKLDMNEAIMRQLRVAQPEFENFMEADKKFAKALMHDRTDAGLQAYTTLAVMNYAATIDGVCNQEVAAHQMRYFGNYAKEIAKLIDRGIPMKSAMLFAQHAAAKLANNELDADGTRLTQEEVDEAVKTALKEIENGSEA